MREVTLDNIIGHFSYFLNEMAKLSPHIGHETTSDVFLDYFHSVSEDALLNGIFIKNTSSQLYLQSLTQCMDKLESQKSPYTLWVPKPLMTPTLNTFLEANHLKNQGFLTCIGADLDEIHEVPTLEKLTIVSVDSEALYDLYMDILALGFQMSESIKCDFKAMLANFNVFKHYIGYWDDEPVSVISTVSHNNSLGMYCGTTLPQYEKMGICTELYRYTMAEGKKANNTHCMYQSANSAIVNHVSKKFGFREYGQLLRFVKV